MNRFAQGRGGFFLPPPQTRRLNSGGGAEGQGEGLYALHANNHETETGVVRVNLATGAVAHCWVAFNANQTVCTDQAE